MRSSPPMYERPLTKHGQPRLANREGPQSTQRSRSPSPPGRSLKGHEERFPPLRLSGRCWFREGTFAGRRGKEEDAPKPAVPLSWVERVKPSTSTLIQTRMRVSPDCFPSSRPGRDRQRGTAMIYVGRFIPTATAGAQPTGDEATAIPFLKRFTSPIPSTVKICDRYPEHLAR